MTFLKASHHTALYVTALPVDIHAFSLIFRDSTIFRLVDVFLSLEQNS